METKKIGVDEKLAFPHELYLKSRNEMKITGVIEVLSATSQIVTLKSSAGAMTVTGENLKIHSLSNTEKILEIEGQINEIKYSQKKKKFLEKMFK